MRLVFLLCFILLFSFAKAQQVKVMKFVELEQIWSADSDTVYLINYWATWCKPCVEELPDFLKINDEFKSRKFKMVLVSLDFPKHIDSRVLPFIERNSIKPQVVILDDDANVWINKVNKDWDGSIPVTQVIHKKGNEFFNGTLNYNELKQIVERKFK